MTIGFRELTRRLRERNALIVHFSARAEMGRGHAFPDDLREAADRIEELNLSCSVVWPDRCLATGSVGLILRPRSIDSIVSAKVSDAGAMQISDGTEINGGSPLTATLLTEIFAATDDRYNELRVTRADVVGWFVDLSSDICIKLPAPPMTIDGLVHDLGIVPQFVDIGWVMAAANTTPVFAFADGRIIQITPGGPRPLAASEIYPRGTGFGLVWGWLCDLTRHIRGRHRAPTG